MDNFTDRPRPNDANIRQVAIVEMAQELAEEWAEGGRTRKDWENILNRITPNFRQNGYEIAKEVERYSSVQPDSTLVELLDNASYHLDRAHEEAVRQWVKHHNLKLSREVGDRVSTPWGEGKITELRPDIAQYIVTPDNDPRFSQGGGWVLVAERCTDVSTNLES